MAMSPIVLEESIRIPCWVSDHASFRRWACSDEFPEHGKFSYLNDEIWVDVSMEKVVHNWIKLQISAVLTKLVGHDKSGRFFVDGMMLVNLSAAVSTEPDGMFVSFERFKSGLVLLEEGMDSLEVIGSPDMTLEVISRHSVRKDTVVLRENYWRAGVREYWLVDSRAERPTLEILRSTARGFVSTRKQAGWVKSLVFGKSFQLLQTADPMGQPEFTLQVR